MKKQWIVVTAVMISLVIAGAAYAGDTSKAGAFFGKGPFIQSMRLKGANPMEAISKATGMTVADLIKERQAGKSFSQILKDKGQDVDALVDRLTGEYKDNLEKMLEDTSVPPAMGSFGLIGKGDIRFGPIEQITEATGMTADEVMKERQAGKSFSQILKDKGQDVDALVTRLIAEHKTRLDEVVSAGKMTQEQANTALTRYEESLRKMLDDTSVPPARGPLGKWRIQKGADLTK